LKLISSLSVSGIFIYFLLAQPFILKKTGFGRDVDGEYNSFTSLEKAGEMLSKTFE